MLKKIPLAALALGILITTFLSAIPPAGAEYVYTNCDPYSLWIYDWGEGYLYSCCGTCSCFDRSCGSKYAVFTSMGCERGPCSGSCGTTYMISADGHTVTFICNWYDASHADNTYSWQCCDKNLILPVVAVTGAPGSWQNTDASSGVSCTHAGSGCNPSSYRIRTYSSNPGSCSTNYNDYPLSAPQAISSHAWVCAAAKDTAGDAGFSTPVEFTVDKTPPAGTIAINNGALYTTSESVTLYLTYSDMGGSGIQNCRYTNDGVFDTEPWEACSATKPWTLTAGTGLKTVYYQIRDAAGNAFQTSDTISILTGGSSCEASPTGFYCCQRSGACEAGEVDVFRMYDRLNAHAELRTQSNYNWIICCGGVEGLGTSCSGIYDTLLKLASTTNSHVEKKTLSNYANPVCLSATKGELNCSYVGAGQSCTALGPDYVCVTSMSGDTNAHVSDCADPSMSTKACCRHKLPPIPQCNLTSATITANCAGGVPGACEVGEAISMSATTTGNCSDVIFFQIDASCTGCSVQYSDGDVSGIYQSNPTLAGDIVSGTVSGTWTITSIPITCSGKTVTATTAGLYNTSSPHPAGLKSMNVTPYVTGSFRFKDLIPPITTITPNGAAWRNSDVPFTLTCTDTGGGSCQATYYKIIDSAQTCAAGGFSTGLSGTVTCPAGSICQSKACFYSTDTDGNTESIQTSNVFQIDKTLPTVDVSHSPANPTDLNAVTFTATASDTGSGLSQITIYVDGSPIGSCGASPCVMTPGVYSTGNHNYYATATDAALNVGQSATKSFAVTGCTLTSATITPNCAGGCNSNCEVGETISMSATTTGNCGAIRFFQIDASGTGCIVQYSGGDVSGVFQNNPTIGSGTVTGTWTITSIPLACSGKTVTASAAGLYNPGPPPSGLVTLIVSPVTGTFTFNDIVPPTTSIDPNGAAWRNTDVPFTLTCTPGGSPCSMTFYKIIDSAQTCAAGGFSTGLSGTVTCASGSVCQRRVCYYSNDTSCNTETPIKTSNIFQIDKAAPTATLTQPPAGWTNQNSIPVAWTGSDTGVGTIASFNVQSRSSWADGSSPTTWADWYSGTGTSGTLSPALDNHTYYFQARATDGVGNVGSYSAVRSISVDLEAPMIVAIVSDDVANSLITISSSARDGGSGIYNHTISCTVISPDSTIFVQCSPAAQFGGISTCQIPPVYYTQETEISCTLWTRDVAGNQNSTGVFFAPLTEHPLIVFVEHSAFMNIGETYHARVYVRNLKSGPDMVNISLGGTYPKDFVTFLESSIITYMSPDKRNITVALNAYEQRIINIRVVSADTEQYDLRVSASSQKYGLQDSDTMNIAVGFPASFPGIDLLSIAAILSLSCLAYFRHLRKPR